MKIIKVTDNQYLRSATGLFVSILGDSRVNAKTFIVLFVTYYDTLLRHRDRLLHAKLLEGQQCP